jgi:hypothetical protein
MAWLTEDPTAILLAIGAIAVGIIIAILKTGRGLYLTWLGGVVLLALLVIVIERYVVTDREKVEDTLYGAAAALEANDVEGVASYLASAGEALEREVRSRMRTMEVRKARIVSDLRIEFSPLETPPKAIATFLGRVEFKAASVPLEQYLGRFKIQLVKEGDRWLVQSYDLDARP